MLKPLDQFLRGQVTVASFSVFVDIRLLRLRLLGQPLPFSDDIQYIFDKQLEEAGLVVISHADQVPPAIARETESLARRRYPDAALRLQNSLDAGDVAGWVDLVSSGTVPAANTSLEIDYARYGAGEADLAWLDERIALTFADGEGRAVVTHMLEEIVGASRRERLPVGHLKCAIESPGCRAKISVTTLDSSAWRDAVPEFSGTGATLILNARVQAGAEKLRALVHAAVQSANGTETQAVAFHPGFPRPAHRIA